MEMFLWLVCIAVASAIVGFTTRDSEYGWKFFIILCVIWAGVLIYRYNTDPEWIKDRVDRDAAVIAQKRADEQPRVIREVDGCKVYAFKSGDRWHYFTRCKDLTTTDTSWGECTGSGKFRRCETRTESMVVSK